MHRVLAIVLLAMLPFQFSWAAVASYYGHEQAGAGHFGHHAHEHGHGHGHEHEHPTDTGTEAEPVADLAASSAVQGDKAPGAMDLDCGNCHGTCSVMLTAASGVPGELATAHPRATLDEAGAAHAPTRPERPQWPPLA